MYFQINNTWFHKLIFSLFLVYFEFHCYCFENYYNFSRNRYISTPYREVPSLPLVLPAKVTQHLKATVGRKKRWKSVKHSRDQHSLSVLQDLWVPPTFVISRHVNPWQLSHCRDLRCSLRVDRVIRVSPLSRACPIEDLAFSSTVFPKKRGCTIWT